MEQALVTPIVVALTVAPLVVAALLVRDAWRVWRPTHHLLRGDWEAARTSADALARSWMRVFPSVRQSARYASACALHLDGKLDASLAATAALAAEPVRGNLRYAVLSLEAANLVLLERDPERALALLEAARRVHRASEDLLLAAHAEHALGRDAEARALFESAGERPARPGRRLGRVAIVESRALKDSMFHALRGLFLARTGRAPEAQHDLALAARSPVPSAYVARARAALEGPRTPAAVDDEGPSSLAPQVVSPRRPPA